MTALTADRWVESQSSNAFVKWLVALAGTDGFRPGLFYWANSRDRARRQ
jgi:hypothetical protein